MQMTDRELDARIVADMIAAAAPKRKPGEKPLDYKLRLQRHRLSLGKRASKDADVATVERYTSGEWALLTDRIRRMHLRDGADFLAWLQAQRWLIEAHPELRALAYRTICARIDQVKRKAGLETDDPAPHPGEKPTLAMRCKALLNVR